MFQAQVERVLGARVVQPDGSVVVTYPPQVAAAERRPHYMRLRNGQRAYTAWWTHRIDRLLSVPLHTVRAQRKARLIEAERAVEAATLPRYVPGDGRIPDERRAGGGCWEPARQDTCERTPSLLDSDPYDRIMARRAEGYYVQTYHDRPHLTDPEADTVALRVQRKAQVWLDDDEPMPYPPRYREDRSDNRLYTVVYRKPVRTGRPAPVRSLLDRAGG